MSDRPLLVFDFDGVIVDGMAEYLSLIHISEPTRHAQISYAVFCAVRPLKQPHRAPRWIGRLRTMNWLLSRNVVLRWNRW